MSTSLSQKNRIRERKREVKEWTEPTISKQPYYTKYRYEQVLEGIGDRDELNLYPQDTIYLTENVIKRTFSREMVWDGLKWVRKRELVPYGHCYWFHSGPVTLSAGQSYTVLDIRGKGWIKEVFFETDNIFSYHRLYADSEKEVWGFYIVASRNWRIYGGEWNTMTVVVDDDVSKVYRALYCPLVPLPFTKRLKIIFYNGSSTSALAYTFGRIWLAEGEVIVKPKEWV